MEADVAIQHAGEMWAAGESLYQSPEKVTYIYSRHGKRKDGRGAGRLRVKPSKSYDNDLEASVARDADVSSRVQISDVRDSISLSSGNILERCPDQRYGSPIQTSLQQSSLSASEKSLVRGGHKGLFTDNTESSHKRNRKKSKPHRDEAKSHKSKHQYLDTSQIAGTCVEDSYGQFTVMPKESKQRHLPVEFHLKEDQLPLLGPKVQCKRPINLSSQLSSLSSPPREKPSSLVILEVKDGPTFFYKPSDHMVSDSGIGEESLISLHGSVSSARSGQRFPGNTELHPGQEFPGNTQLNSGQRFLGNTQEHPEQGFSGNTQIYSGQKFYGNAELYSGQGFPGNTQLYSGQGFPGNTQLYSGQGFSGNTQLYPGQKIHRNAHLYQGQGFFGNTQLYPGQRFPGNAEIYSGQGFHGTAEIYSGQGFPGNTELYSLDPLRNVPTSAYTGSYSFSKPEISPLSMFRRGSGSGLHSALSISHGATITSAEGSPKPRCLVSQLPRTHGLRKPDLSVLSPPHKSKSNFDDLVSQGLAEVSQGLTEVSQGLTEISKGLTDNAELSMKPQVASKIQESLLVSTDLPVSSNLHTNIVLEEVVLPKVLPQPNSDHQTNSKSTPSDSEQISADLVNAIETPKIHKEYAIPPALPAPALDSTCGFENTYEILQQKAGIKHDDIVVGPRRPLSRILHDDSAGVPSNAIASMKYEFHRTDMVSGKPKLNLYSSTDGLSSNHSEQLLQRERPARKGTCSESDSSSIATVAYPDPIDSAAMNALKPQEEDGVQNKVLKFHKHDKALQSSNDRRSLEAIAYVLGDVSLKSDTGFKPKERTSDIQNPRHRKNLSGHSSELIQSRSLNIESSLENIIPYKTKSLDRNHKSTEETKIVSKSSSASPSKQELHSPKSKTSTTNATKRQATNPKLHMLSNIPVPIGHDPPAKRHSYQRPGSAPEPTQTNVPSHFQTEQAVLISESTKDKSVSLTEQPPTQPAPPPASKSPHPPVAGATSSTTEQITRAPTPKIDAPLTKVTSQPTSEQPPALVQETIKRDVQHPNTAEEHNLSKVPSMTKVGADQPSTTEVDTNKKSTETFSDSPVNTPARPRLHRSAEQLLGDSKLAVFNSAENVLHFDNTESSNTRVFQDSAKSEKAGGDSIGPLKKNHGLAKCGIMRRGSDRTEMCRRGSERTILPINRNDPSVEDLKKATSLKELCQSMASLLNIDNVKAAEMITTSLSQREDLVEGLDADAILDYLSHHGVLDPGILVGMAKNDQTSITQRNSAILRHVEEHGNTAVALFINALRQSGQLHLASSLDTEQRIKPVSGNGYFGKDRHKGELTLRIEIESLKILAPREPRSEKIVDTSLLGSPGLFSPDAGVIVKDASEDEDFVKPRCWCFCFSYKSKLKSLSKKDNEKQKKSSHQKRNQSKSPEKESIPSEEVAKKNTTSKPHKAKSQEKSKKGTESVSNIQATESSNKDHKNREKESNKKSKSKSKQNISGKSSEAHKTEEMYIDQYHSPEADCQLRPHEKTERDGQRDSSCKMTLGLRPYISQQPHTMQHQPYNSVHSTTSNSTSPKEAWDPIIMEYNPQLELIKLRAGQEELASPTRQSGHIGIMCEQWKSNGRHFQQKASQLCERIVQEVHMEIIKYFEQDRGTLVLDVISDCSCILVINICMMRTQVKSLQQEIADDSLLNKIQDMFFSKVDITEFDIRGVKLRIFLDEQELNTVLSELS